jgi:hypothetical protein
MAVARIKIDNQIDMAFIWECLDAKLEAYQLMSGMAFAHKPIEGIFEWGRQVADEQAQIEQERHGRTKGS